MTSPSLPIDANLPGTPYRIVRLLGSGGMGEVYEAEHTLLGARRALKVLSPQTGESSRIAERIKTEARSLAKLQHPNLVEVVDLGISEGRWYFAMTLLEGATLREVANQRGAMPWDEAARIVIAVLDGLHAAHGLGLVHRDVKPENTFVCDDGGIKVLDFGIAKVAALDAITRSGHTIGTPRYMAPEQIEGKAVDARTDVYAAAIVLFELVAGRAPFVEEESLALAYAHVHRAAPPLPNVGETGAGGRLQRAVAKALAKPVDARFESAEAFATELRGCLADAGFATSPAPIARRIAGKQLGALAADTPRETPPAEARSAPTKTMTSDAIAKPAFTNDAVAVKSGVGARTSYVAMAAAAIAVLAVGIVATRTRVAGGIRDTETIAPSGVADLAAQRARSPSSAPLETPANGGAASGIASAVEPIVDAGESLTRASDAGTKRQNELKNRGTVAGKHATAATSSAQGAGSDAGRARREDDSLILE